MKLETFFEKFDQFADAPDAVAKMRGLIGPLRRGDAEIQTPSSPRLRASAGEQEIARRRREHSPRSRRREWSAFAIRTSAFALPL